MNIKTNNIKWTIKGGEFEVIDKSTNEVVHSSILDNDIEYKFAPRNRVTFKGALDAYTNYKQIQCLILNEEGLVVEVETYYRGEGLNVCLDFYEMLNGHWFILD